MDTIKILREETGLSFAQIKKALDETGNDIDKAREVLREYSVAQAEKKADREIGAGIVSAYVHATGTMGAMIILSCETDFVAKHEEFKALAYDIALHVCAMGNDTIEEIMNEQFVKDPEMTVAQKIQGAIQKFGENIRLSQVTRFTV